MNRFMSIIASLFIFSVANAESLDQAMKAQEIKTISPAQVDGKSIGSYNAVPSIVAAEVCKALGFVRLVDFKTEDCNPGESLYRFLNSGTTSFLTQVNASPADRQCQEQRKGYRLASVSCAR